MVHRCITGEPPCKGSKPNTNVRCVKTSGALKRQRLGRTGRQRRARRLSLPNKCRNVKYKRKLRSYDKEAEKSRGSKTDYPVKQHEFWALPKMSELRSKQLKDTDIAPLIKWKEDRKRPIGKEVSSSSPATCHYWLYLDALFLTDGVLFRKFMKRDGTGNFVQFIVP